MDFSFFITNNKSGYKTRENWFKANHPEEYSTINQYCEKLNLNLSFKEKILFYFKKLSERPKCLTCQGEIKFRDRLDVPYGEFCSIECINTNKTEMIERQKKHFQKKYGVDFYTKTNEFIIKQKHTKKKKYGDENYNNKEKAKETKKVKYGNENYNNQEKHKITCLTKYDTENYSKSNTYRKWLEQNFRNLYPTINFTNVGKNFVKFKCNNCDSEIEITKQLLYERFKRNHDVCTKCNPIGQSNRSFYEKELTSFFDELKVSNQNNVRNIIKGEIDVYLPQNKIAVEINGLYWHNELFVHPNYHLDKTIQAQNQDIQLLHIFEDEWLYKKEIVKSILKNKLKITPHRIYARKCRISEIDNKTSKKFLKQNHIQGEVNSKIRLGLFYENELVSLITFSKGRVIMGGKDNEWELTRFCNKLETNVIGAANKLFKHFVNSYKPEKIISYSDIRLFDGGLYTTLGFERKSQSPPNYWYVINGVRYYRFNFRKSKLVTEGYDKNKTEKQIMFDRKIYRIYDCGNIRWEYNSHMNNLNYN